MSNYFVTITFINLFTLLMLSVSIITNAVINKEQKKNFLLTCIIVFIICIMEVLTIIANGADVKYRWIHIFSNFMGFNLTPMVFMFLGTALIPNKRRSWEFILWAGYTLWMLITLFMNNSYGIFHVDEANNYSRAKGFVIYTLFYGFALIYFFIENIRLSIKYWHTSNIILLLNFAFVFTGTTVQIIYPEIQVSWLSVVISIVFYYIYIDNLYQQLDRQTYLMNGNSFEKYICNQKKTAVIIVAEIDNFSKLKLNYSRSKLDEILMDISRNFNDYFKKYGRTFRIESEELCAVIYDRNLDFDAIIKDFFIKYVKSNFTSSEIPLVSLGYALFSPHQDLKKVLSAADMKKRDFIKERLNLFKSPKENQN